MHKPLHRLRSGLLLSGCLLASQLSNAQAGIEEVRQCMQANLPATVELRQLQLQYVNRLGEASSYELQIYARHGEGEFDASLMVKQPSKLAGSAYLLQSTADSYQLYLYAPSLAKVRRVSGEGLAQSSLLGTDLSWEDLQFMYSAVQKGSMELTGEAELQSRPVYLLQLIPSPETESAYQRIHIDVDKQSCVPLQMRFMLANDVESKRFIADANSLTQANGGYWYAAKTRMEDLREGTHTRVDVLREIKADKRLWDRLFNSSSFYKGR